MNTPYILDRLNHLDASETYSVLEILSKYDSSLALTKEHSKNLSIKYKPDFSITIYDKSNTIVDQFQPMGTRQGNGQFLLLAMNEVVSFLRGLKLDQLDLT